jgi:hypothetical protein
MRNLICLMLTGFYLTSAVSQEQQEKISTQLYYLQEARANLSYTRNYADSAYVNTLLDSLDRTINKLITYIEAIPVEPMAEEVVEESVDMEELAADTTPVEQEFPEYQETTSEEFPDVYDQPENNGSGNPFIDKYNPFKKMKSKFIIETGINNFFMQLSTVASEPIVNSGSSWFWNFGLIKQIPLSRKIRLHAGLTYLRNRFRFANDLRLSGDSATPSFVEVGNAAEDPKLIVHYFTLPISFEIKFTKSLHIHLGGYAGYNVGAQQKLSLKVGDEEISENRNGAYGINKWMYGVRGGIGIGGFDVFAQYNLSNFFESNLKYDYKIYMIGTTFKF